MLAEFYGLLKKAGRAQLHLPYVRALLASPHYRFEPLIADDLERIVEFADVPEMHDRLIAVTAARLGATVITRDREIRSAAKVRCLWW